MLAALFLLMLNPAPGRADLPDTKTDGILQQDMLVARVNHRLALANADWCPQTTPLTGMLLHDIAAYDPDARAAIEERFALGRAPGLRGVVPGSAAQRAGLQADDVILALGPTQMATLYPELIGHKASIARSRKLEAWLALGLEAGPQTLTVRRKGRLLSTSLSAPRGCAGHAQAEPGEAFDAWSDGHDVAVSKGVLAGVRSEDELAFILAHEMGHNWLDEVSHGRGERLGSSPLAQILGVRVSEESRADLIAVAAMRRAGYDSRAAGAMLERLAATEGPLHLSRGKRVQLKNRKNVLNRAIVDHQP